MILYSSTDPQEEQGRAVYNEKKVCRVTRRNIQDDVFRAMGQMLPSLSPVTHTHRVVRHLLLTGPREKSASAVRVLCGGKHNMGHRSPPEDCMRLSSSMICSMGTACVWTRMDIRETP